MTTSFRPFRAGPLLGLLLAPLGFFAPGPASVAEPLPGAPTIVGQVPEPAATVRELTQVEVIFDRNVQGVDAHDLEVNGVPATGLRVYSPRDYLFEFAQPDAGLVRLTWTTGHGIVELDKPAAVFAGPGWDYTLDPSVPRARVIVSEFLADNARGLRDEDGDRSDWLELRNLEAEAVNLEGWSLTDDPLRPRQWVFPPVTLAPGGYLLVWASEKNRASGSGPLHTNFKLGRQGEYLALIDPNGEVVSAFAPAYPAQPPDVSYGVDQADPTAAGYFLTPTPGAANATSGSGFAPSVLVSLPGGAYTNGTVTIGLELASSPAAPATIRYTLNGTVPVAASPVYAEPLVFSTSVVVQARAFVPGLLPGPVTANAYHLVGRDLTNFSSNLPLVILNTSRRSIPQDRRILAGVTIVDTWRGRARLTDTPQHQGMAQVEIRGQSSAGFPKKSYNLELDDPAGADLDVPLLGLPAESDWVLYAPYTDKSFMNDVLAYELHEAMGHYAVRRRFVELFVDASGGRLDGPGDYAGIYVLLEKIKVSGDRVDVARLTPGQTNEPAISGGYIVKKDKDSPGDRGFSTSGGGGFGGQYLKYHEPKPREIVPAQERWIRTYLNQFERALYSTSWKTATGTNHYSAYIDVDSFVDNHWIVEFAKQIDGYRLSTYFSKDRDGKLKMEPIWDWNLSFGNADYLSGQSTSGWYYPQLDANAHIWLRRLINGTSAGGGTAGDPDFNQRIVDRWGEFRTNVFAVSNVLARVNAIAARLDEAQARDFKRWPRLGTYIWPNPPIYSTPRTYAGIVTNLRTWISGRFAWIDNQFTKPPEILAPGGFVTPGFMVALRAPAGQILYTLDGSDPRAPGGAVAPAALTYATPLEIPANARVVARARNGTKWSGPVAATFLTTPPRLLVTEVMYRPAPGGWADDPDRFEFIELANASDQPLELRGFRFDKGVAFDFSTGRVAQLPPGGRVLVVRDLAAFTARYGSLENLAGQYTGGLANEGERLTLTGPLGELADDFRYDPAELPATDGVGFSLVREPASERPGATAPGWRVGSVPGGSPGSPDPSPATIHPVVINEVLTRPVSPELDAIELHNPNPFTVDVGGWFLSDDPRTPKYLIPRPTFIGPRGYRVFTAREFNARPGTPGSFDLRDTGDEAVLFSADGQQRLTGYVDAVRLGPAARGVSFGRLVTSDAQTRWMPQSAVTLGRPNAAPLVGPIVIGEIMYRPPEVRANNASWDNTEHEFIELHNVSSTSVPLFDPAAPGTRWALRDAVDYAFPADTVLAPDERVLVVSFDPSTQPAAATDFRTLHSLDPRVRLFGPYDRKLGNRANQVELVRVETFPLEGTNTVNLEVLVDRVAYQADYPWPAGADGLGFTLQRLDDHAVGDEPRHWIAGRPSPGQPRPALDPIEIAHVPREASVNAGGSHRFTVEATSPAPLRYQWRFRGENLEGQTNAVLEFAAATPAQAGLYDVAVLGRNSAVGSIPVRLAVVEPIQVTAQPQSTEARPGAFSSFRVSAISQSPLRFQWRRHGRPIDGATGPALEFAAVTPDDTGLYDVVIADAAGNIASAPARLTVLVEPAIVQPPLSQTAASGQTVTLSVAVTATATLPVTYRWERDGVAIAERTLEATSDFLTLASVEPNHAGVYRVVVANRAGPPGGFASATAALTVAPAPDRDSDGLPDAYEQAHRLDPDLASDALQDPDGDGVLTRDEYLTGTDPNDPDSFLRVEILDSARGALLRFRLAAHRTATLLYRDQLGRGTWHPLAGIPAAHSDATELRSLEILDETAPTTGERYYRLAVPATSE